jgi:hypothetical protein
MTYSIFTGKQRSLVFPIMCNGFLTLDYSANISNSDDAIPYGLWKLDEDFTFECVLTPYEINGYGSHSISGANFMSEEGSLTKLPDLSSATNANVLSSSSKKIMTALSKVVYDSHSPNIYESELYLSRTARLTHEMRIFHNDNFQVSLVNSTTHNQNNPARYKIKVGIKLGSAAMEYFTTDEVIIPNEGRQMNIQTDSSIGHTRKLGGGIVDEKLEYIPLRTDRYITSVSTDTLTFNGSINSGQIDSPDADKLEIFVKQNGQFLSLGTINSFLASNIIKLTATPSFTVETGTSAFIYVKNKREPSYINNTFHIACSWDNLSKVLIIYFNGQPVKLGTHTQTTSFGLAQSDCFIGANGTNATGAGSATTNNQFMGELHELAIINRRLDRFNINNLTPPYNETVLYLRFEEVDE